MIQSQSLKTCFPPLPFDSDILYYDLNHDETNEGFEKFSSAYEPDDITEDKNVELSGSHRKKKSLVEMEEKAELFKFSFYQSFTSRKKFPKKYVILIHNEICLNLNLRGINRDETRSIDLYFVNFAKHSEKILLFIKNNKKGIIKKIPELNEIVNLKK